MRSLESGRILPGSSLLTVVSSLVGQSMPAIKISDIFRTGAVLALALVLGAAGAQDAGAQVDLASLAEKFTFREVGPANPGGRIIDVEGVETAPHILYIGTATGGVWKTVNAGITWEPLFDDQPIASIGDIGLSRSDPNVLYVGTGEANNRNSSPWGAGVFKSTDGGENWIFLGLEETRAISRVVVHPTNPDIVYVAAMGHLWGFNEERGVYKSTDGGRNWDKVLYLDEETGITDLAMDPVDPNILYAVGHMRERDKFDAGDPIDQWGPKAGIYITRDGGGSWTKAEEGLPTVEMGRTGIDVSRSAPGTVYAVVSTEPPPRPEGAGGQRQGAQTEAEPLDPNRDGIFKSTDYGVTWEKVNDWRGRPSYYSQIRVDPNDADVIWALDSNMGYSDDGGITMITGEPVQGSTHIDYHGGWIDPEQLGPRHRGRRRGDQRHLGPGGELGSRPGDRPGPDLPVLRRHAETLLPGSGPSGQWGVGWPEPGPDHRRRYQQRLVRLVQRRWLWDSDRSHRFQHHLRRNSEREYLPPGPAGPDRTSGSGPSLPCRRVERSGSVTASTGIRPSSSPPTIPRPSMWAGTKSSSRSTWGKPSSS